MRSSTQLGSSDPSRNWCKRAKRRSEVGNSLPRPLLPSRVAVFLLTEEDPVLSVLFVGCPIRSRLGKVFFEFERFLFGEKCQHSIGSPAALEFTFTFTDDDEAIRMVLPKVIRK